MWMQVEIDARQVNRRIVFGVVRLAAASGRLRLFYPKWIPGEHGPTGLVAHLMGLKIYQEERMIPWRRDPLEMHTIECELTGSADRVAVEIEFAFALAGGGFFSANGGTPELAVLNWHQILLYPAADIRSLTVEATLRLPGGWQFATALPVARERPDGILFEPASLDRLIDSPVLAGRHMRRFDLATQSGPPHCLAVAADSPNALKMTAEQQRAFRRLVPEALALFGPPHYRQYQFLLALSDHIAHFGLEHQESSDNRLSEDALTDEKHRRLGNGLLPHEFVHSWNGKFRRPAGMTVFDYQQPLDTTLLWVYEGLTTYLGNVLTARCGLYSAQEYRDHLARGAAQLAHRPGRQWRPLADTAVAAQVLFDAPGEWDSLRRNVDFYGEGELLWLEADALIRERTGGRRSTDDFCRAFFAGPEGLSYGEPYEARDVFEALSHVVAYDWEQFFETRLQGLGTDLPRQALERAGWQLSFDESPNLFDEAIAEVRKTCDHWHSLGMKLNKDAKVVDVAPGMPAESGGVAPGMQVLAVNGRRFTSDRLKAALDNSRQAGKLDLLVEDRDFYRTLTVNVDCGPRYPHLTRIAHRQDWLQEMIRPRLADEEMNAATEEEGLRA